MRNHPENQDKSGLQKLVKYTTNPKQDKTF